MEIERPKSKQPLPPHAKKVFSGKIFDVFQWEQELFNGTKAIFEKVRRPDTVIIFPVLPNGKIILTDQEQPGKERFLGAAGGQVDDGEDILAAAKRELLEETGYEADQWILWDAQQPTSKMEWAIYTFVVKGVRKVADLNLDAGEKITLREVSFDEFIALGSDPSFSEKEIKTDLLRARLEPKKMEELRQLFSPN